MLKRITAMMTACTLAGCAGIPITPGNLLQLGPNNNQQTPIHNGDDHGSQQPGGTENPGSGGSDTTPKMPITVLGVVSVENVAITFTPVATDSATLKEAKASIRFDVKELDGAPVSGLTRWHILVTQWNASGGQILNAVPDSLIEESKGTYLVEKKVVKQLTDVTPFKISINVTNKPATTETSDF